MLTKESNAVKKKTFKNNSDTLLKTHTLHLIYVHALDLSQNKKQSFLLTVNNLDVYFIVHVYMTT